MPDHPNRLNHPVSPAEPPSAAPPLNQGDDTDDPQDIADRFKLPVPPVEPAAAPSVTPRGHPLPDYAGPSITTVLTGRVPLGVSVPQLLVPADPRRKHLVISGTTDFRWAADQESMWGAGYHPSGVPCPVPGHTGAVWVLAESASTSAYCYYWSVTE